MCLIKLAVAKIQLKKSYFKVHISSFSEVQTLEQLECKNILFRDYGTSMRGINHRLGFNYINLSDLGEAGNVPGLLNFRVQSFINLGFTKNGLGFCLESLLQV